MTTALRSVIDTVVGEVGASLQGRSARITHCLVGDGVCTHAAATRLLWSWASAAPVAPRYRLLMFTCSTHAANVVVRSAVTEDEHKRNGDLDSHPLVAMCVRCFKYLMPEYESEFLRRLRTHVESRLKIVDATPLPISLQEWVGLRELYGNRIPPDRLRVALN